MMKTKDIRLTALFLALCFCLLMLPLSSANTANKTTADLVSELVSGRGSLSGRAVYEGQLIIERSDDNSWKVGKERNIIHVPAGSTINLGNSTILGKMESDDIPTIYAEGANIEAFDILRASVRSTMSAYSTVIIGSGVDCSIMNANLESGSIVISERNVEYTSLVFMKKHAAVTLTNVAIDVPNNNERTYGIIIDSDKSYSNSRVTIDNCRINIRGPNSNTGIWVLGGNEINVKNSTIVGGGASASVDQHGIVYTGPVQSGTIENNTISGFCYTAYAPSSGAAAGSNELKYASGITVKTEYNRPNPTNISVINNTIDTGGVFAPKYGACALDIKYPRTGSYSSVSGNTVKMGSGNTTSVDWTNSRVTLNDVSSTVPAISTSVNTVETLNVPAQLLANQATLVYVDWKITTTPATASYEFSGKNIALDLTNPNDNTALKAANLVPTFTAKQELDAVVQLTVKGISASWEYTGNAQLDASNMIEKTITWNIQARGGGGGQTASPSPSQSPGTSPSTSPSASPSINPSTSPSPSVSPSVSPTVRPSAQPSASPTSTPKEYLMRSTFDKTTGALLHRDQLFDFGLSVSSIIYGNYTLLYGSQYTVSRNVINIPASFLRQFPVGDHYFYVTFSNGSKATLIVNVIQSSPATAAPTATPTTTQGPGGNIIIIQKPPIIIQVPEVIIENEIVQEGTIESEMAH